MFYVESMLFPWSSVCPSWLLISIGHILRLLSFSIPSIPIFLHSSPQTRCIRLGLYDWGWSWPFRSFELHGTTCHIHHVFHEAQGVCQEGLASLRSVCRLHISVQNCFFGLWVQLTTASSNTFRALPTHNFHECYQKLERGIVLQFSLQNRQPLLVWSLLFPGQQSEGRPRLLLYAPSLLRWIFP